jgi:hypothetical protein
LLYADHHSGRIAFYVMRFKANQLTNPESGAIAYVWVL